MDAGRSRWLQAEDEASPGLAARFGFLRMGANISLRSQVKQDVGGPIVAYVAGGKYGGALVRSRGTSQYTWLFVNATGEFCAHL